MDSTIQFEKLDETVCALLGAEFLEKGTNQSIFSLIGETGHVHLGCSMNLEEETLNSKLEVLFEESVATGIPLYWYQLIPKNVTGSLQAFIMIIKFSEDAV